jgi:ubiquinone biosynthesis monooxygenase Coq7
MGNKINMASKIQTAKKMELPGDLDKDTIIERMIRVNQAGEYGAKRIYEGQLAVLKGTESEGLLREMLDHELVHLDKFNKEMVNRKVRPTALQPVWHIAGFIMGVGSALLGKNAAMACTVAVEEVIEEHYSQQVQELGDEESELKSIIQSCLSDEQEHRNIGLEQGAESAPGYDTITATVKNASRLAIWLSTRI